MKKIIIITSAIILFMIASFKLSLLYNDFEKSDSSFRPTINPTSIKEPENISEILKNQFVIPETNTQFYMTIVNESYPNQIIQSNSNTQWQLQKDNTTLEINLVIDENSPFSSSTKPELEVIMSESVNSSIFRLKVEDGNYIYTNSYYEHDCGDNYCSNGSTDFQGNLITINCFSENKSSITDVIYCDDLVRRLFQL